MKFLLVVAATLAVAAAGSVAPGLRSKVRAGEVTEAILELPSVTDQLESNAAFQALSGDARAVAVHTILEGLTTASQAPYVSVMKAAGLTVQQFWASNIVLVKGITEAHLDTLATMKGEFVLREQFTASVNSVIVDRNATIIQNPQWGVAMVRAPAAWSVTQGAGCIAIIVDTGVHPNHEALTRYAGGWSDSYYNTANPTDQHGHGTHCAGSILGHANGVGVAPAAQWVACRGLNHQGSGTEAALIGCAQFSVTTRPMPHVSSNSWGGGQNAVWYNQAITSMRNAGIIPVFAIGNSGSGCRTANSPGDSNAGNIAVGATTTTDTMATFSSRGPTSAGALKPEISAPGQNIVSCGTGANNYVTMSGTSMATPHVAGAVCLILSAHPTWTFQQVLDALISSAAHPTLSAADRNCGLPTPGQDFPNNAWGHGRIDVGRALGQ
jgi:subtilisin family serine protease